MSTTTATPFRIQTPGDVVALVDQMLGFRPAESFVMIAYKPVCFVARVDLMPEDAEMYQNLADAYRANECTDWLMVIFTEQYADPEVLGLIELAAALAFPNGPTASFVVTDNTASHLDGHNPCEVPTPDGILPDRVALEESLRPVTPINIGENTMSSEQLVAWVRENRDRLYGSGEPMTDDEVETYVHACNDTTARDAAWGAMNRAQAVAALPTLRALATTIDGPLRPRVMAVVAFTAWLAGNGGLGWCAVDQAADDDGLAGIVREALTDAVSPNAWTPVDGA